MVVLLLRHVLSITSTGAEEDASTFFMVSDFLATKKQSSKIKMSIWPRTWFSMAAFPLTNSRVFSTMLYHGSCIECIAMQAPETGEVLPISMCIFGCMWQESMIFFVAVTQFLFMHSWFGWYSEAGSCFGSSRSCIPITKWASSRCAHCCLSWATSVKSWHSLNIFLPSTLCERGSTGH